MVDAERAGAVGALSRQLQAISGIGWTNVQTPVRQGFEAMEATAQQLAEQLAASREDVRRLEARLVGMEDMVRVLFGLVAGLKTMGSNRMGLKVCTLQRYVYSKSTGPADSGELPRPNGCLEF